MGESSPSNTNRRPTPRGPKRCWSSAGTHSSGNPAFSVLASDASHLKEVLHGGSNFRDVCLCRKVSGVKELNLRTRYVLLKGFSARWNKEGVILAPDRKQRGFRLSEILLEFWVEPYVRRIIQEQIKLNLFVSRTFEQGRIQYVRLRRNALRICHAMGVLPAGSSRCQNAFAKYVSIVFRGCSPVLSDRVPSIAKAFFVRVPILRNNCCYAFGVCHRQAEASGRAVVKHVDGIAVEFECLSEGLDRESQLVERIRILAFRRDFREPETRKIRRDHAVVIGQPRNEFAKHER